MLGADSSAGPATRTNTQSSGVDLPGLTQEICFRDVSFSYSGAEHEVMHLNFAVPAGSSIAVVGHSGSGKSTLLKLLLRIYEPSTGWISIDGVELSAVGRSSLHAQIGVVLQDPILLNTTVRDNIALVKPDASDPEIEAAARAVDLHETIVSWPQGYDTVVGERGQRLTMGQRQRVALARAIVRKPAILLFDEVTAHLDPETEAAVNATLQRLSAGRTIISITHRLASAMDADRILVMNRGQLVEHGSHEELLGQKGMYFRLWRAQSGFAISADGRHAEITVDRIRAIPLFATLGERALKSLKKRFITEYYDSGSAIVTEGEIGAKFYILVRGVASVTTTGFDGNKLRLPDLEDGDYFGETALMEGGGQPATVRAQTPCLLLSIKGKRFFKLIRKKEALREEVEQTAVSRSLDMVVRRGRRPRTNSSLYDYLLDDPPDDLVADDPSRG